jgi:hypothetical protein
MLENGESETVLDDERSYENRNEGGATNLMLFSM